MKNISLFILCILLFFGCVTEYHATITEKPGDILVVEGIITNDSTFIILSHAVPVESRIYDTVYIENAVLYVECDNGWQSSESQYIGKGRYRIETGKLNSERKYSLRIFANKNEFQSEFLSPMFTPEIDSVLDRKSVV